MNFATNIYLGFLFFLLALLAFAALWWAANALHSALLSLSLAAARRHKSAQLAISGNYGADQYGALPTIWRPFYSYTRAEARPTRGEIPHPEDTLLYFERLLIAAAPKEMFFVRFGGNPAPGERLCSLVGVYPLDAFALGLVWVTLEPRGPLVEWSLHCAEVRSWRTPSEAYSHFPRPHRTAFQPQNSAGQDPSSAWVSDVWKFLSLDTVTENGAKRADYLERFVLDLWTEALQPTRTAAATPNPLQTGRPTSYGAPRTGGSAPPRPRRPQYRG